MEDNIRDICEGRHVPVDHVDKQPKEDLATLPVVKKNVCYICCSVLFDDEGRVLLVQEAKRSCYGRWYLPTGRLEPGETIIDGSKREVKEESGLECDLTTLLSVELNGTWMRFTFTGQITGGKLKTLEEKDSESLQAKFFSLNELPQDIRPTKLRNDANASGSQGVTETLRAKDILPLIEIGKMYREHRRYSYLPVIHPHKHIIYRFVILNTSNTSEPVHMLAGINDGTRHIPYRLQSITAPVFYGYLVGDVCHKAFSTSPLFKVLGVLGIEHRGTGKMEDGACITLLIVLDLKGERDPPAVTSPQYSWDCVTDSRVHSMLCDWCQKKIVPVLK